MKASGRAGLDTVMFRPDVISSDPDTIRVIVESTGFFSDEETGIAAELADERLKKGDASGYFFLFAEHGGETVGYSCYGPIPGTRSSFDLYWIAVRDDRRGMGHGKMLMERSEAAIRQMGGTRVYIDTSSREQYKPTRGFYESCGYAVEAVLNDFYAPGDSKVIYLKRL